MTQDLSSNPTHVDYLCTRLGLGSSRGSPSRVTGGLQHRMWRLNTDRGSFAVKQLSANIDLDDPDKRHHYNASESIAEAFANHGVPAVFARRHAGDYLQIFEGAGYLVHPWCDATALRVEQVSEQHALQVAQILAKMHDLQLAFPGLKKHTIDAQSVENICMLVELAQAFHAKLADTLQRGLPTFLEIVDAQAAATETLDRHLVISHGDLDQKNVLWDARGGPWLIDWESARQLNPTYEILLEALNWSGAWSRFDPDLFGDIIGAYRRAGGVIEGEAVTAAYHCILGDWVYWLMYNVGRCLDQEDPARRRKGEKQISFALAVLQRIMDHVPELLSAPNPPATRSEHTADV
jgi:aminoglycoside phosphotransferase (APT) family kinase protein